MAELTVSFKTSSFSSAARTLGRSFDTRYSDYQGVRKKILSENTSRSYLGSSGSYLQKKMNSLDSKRDKLDRFQKQVENFCKEAQRVDKAVAARINTGTKAVCKRLGIQTGFLAATATILKGGLKLVWKFLSDPLGSLKELGVSLWDGIKKFYQKHKKVIDIILAVGVAIAVVLAAIAGIAAIIGTGGAAAGLFAALLAVGKAILVVKSVWDLGVGLAELGAKYVFKNEDLAQTLSQLSTNKLIQQVGKNLDEHFDTGHFWETAFGVSAAVLDVIIAVDTIKKTAVNIGKAFKSINVKSLKDFKQLLLHPVKSFKTLSWSGATKFTKKLLGIPNKPNAAKIATVLHKKNLFGHIKTWSQAKDWANIYRKIGLTKSFLSYGKAVLKDGQFTLMDLPILNKIRSTAEKAGKLYEYTKKPQEALGY